MLCVVRSLFRLRGSCCMSQPMELSQFDGAWRVLSKEGMCDDIGGMEYFRVRLQWAELGGVVEPFVFIPLLANATPDRWNYILKKVRQLWFGR